MKYMLDSGIIAGLKNAEGEHLIRKLLQHDPGDICISSLTMAQLEKDISNSSRPQRNRLALMLFLSGMEIVPFDRNAAREYGLMQNDQKEKQTPEGVGKLMLAAHARALDVTLVTDKSDVFEKIEGLKLENWA